MNAGTENRVFERFSARFPAKFKHSPSEFGTDVFLRDASAQGARVTTRERLFQNDHVSLMVKLPDGHEPIIMDSEVKWTKNTSSNSWDVGLQFHKVSLMKMQRIFRHTAPAEDENFL